MGFKVVHLKNCDTDKLADAVHTFTGSLGRGDTAVSYFAGHGCEFETQNYLQTTTPCPVKDMKGNAMSAHDIQRDMEDRRCA